MSKFGMLNRFKYNPTNVSLPRSVFDKSFSHKSTFSSGYLIPIALQEVLPGDTYNVDVLSVVRMLTPAVPVMDNANIDIYAFYAPNRILTKGPTDWQEIMGENVKGYWAQQVEKTLSNTGNTFPISVFGNYSGEEGIQSMSLASYLGMPIITSEQYKTAAYIYNEQINMLPYTMYLKVWNEWFRDENTQEPSPMPYESSGVLNGLGLAAGKSGSVMKRVNKVHDYFTSALNAPQKGQPITIPLLGEANVYVKDEKETEMYMFTNSGGNVNADDPVIVSKGGGMPDIYLGSKGSSGVAAYYGIGSKKSSDSGKSNFYADLASASAISVNEIRQAFAIQRILEKDARGGTRYIEYLKAHFGVSAPNDVLQRPEYLCGVSIPLNISTVLQTSSTVENVSPLGATGAFSNSSPRGSFMKSFIEHGYIMIFICVRTEQTYCQGIPILFSRNRRFDFYDPALANISEQPIRNKELYLLDSKFNEVFGYKEPWAEYRYNNNLVSGNLAPTAGDVSLSPWTYAGVFSKMPVLNSEFKLQSPKNIGDTLVDTTTTTQFLCDFYFKITYISTLPAYSIPGLIDHN